MTDKPVVTIRLEKETKDQMLRTLSEELLSPGGKAGGLSMLFRRLAWLYTDDELPQQRWENNEFRIDSATYARDLIQKAEAMLNRNGNIPDDDKVTELEKTLEVLLKELARENNAHSCFQRLEHHSLVGRIVSILHRLGKYRLA
ncbi:MAG: hypothetical protein KC800_00350 [Candidatus Eremiobacteraeota bacterium]|nr:hypothetical protein [Candidatus Eremiobacteraeota bacterium]